LTLDEDALDTSELFSRVPTVVGLIQEENVILSKSGIAFETLAWQFAPKM